MNNAVKKRILATAAGCLGMIAVAMAIVLVLAFTQDWHVLEWLRSQQAYLVYFVAMMIAAFGAGGLVCYLVLRGKSR